MQNALERYLMIETIGDGPGSRFHTATPGGYLVMLDHVGCIGLGIPKVHYSFAV